MENLKTRNLLVLSFLVMLITAIVSYFFPDNAQYKTTNLVDLVVYFVAYFFVALILEIFASNTIGLWLSYLVAQLEIIQTEKGRLLEDYYKSDESQTDLTKEKLLKTDHAIAQEKSERLKAMKSVYYATILFGLALLLSFSGLRMLSYFIEVDHLQLSQSSLFRYLDMLITAGALSGGALAIRKVGIATVEYKNELSRKRSNRVAGSL